MGAPALRRAADDDEQAGQGDRPLPARRGGRAAAPRRGDRRAQARRTPEDALAVVLRLLVAQRLADTAGLPNADRQGIYEPQELAASPTLDKLAARSPALGQAAPRRAGGRARAARAGVARRAGGEAPGAARQARGRASPSAASAASARSRPPPTPIEKHGALVHAGDCEQQWGSATDADEEAAAGTRPSGRLSSLDSTRGTDALDPYMPVLQSRAVERREADAGPGGLLRALGRRRDRRLLRRPGRVAGHLGRAAARPSSSSKASSRRASSGS